MQFSSEQYQDALNAPGILKERSRELMALIFHAPRCRISSRRLGQTMGYSSFAPVNALIGKLGKRITQHLGFGPPSGNPRNPKWWSTVVSGESRDNRFSMALKEELFDALVELDLLTAPNPHSRDYPEIVPGDHQEGAARRISVVRYERDEAARNMCIQHWGLSCSVCGLNFQEKYGALGAGFIHVHHLVPLSSIARDYIVHPVDDLRPVCPNCHAILHRGPRILPIEELRSIVAQNPD